MRPLGFVFDTSDLSSAALRSWIKDFVSVDAGKLTLQFESFGYKHGVPLDADLVFDVRCLANPYYEPTLQPLTGRDLPVVAFLEKEPAVERMYRDIERFVADWLPEYARDNRNYLTVAIGCTGGRHRSVYLVERLAKAFRSHESGSDPASGTRLKRAGAIRCHRSCGFRCFHCTPFCSPADGFRCGSSSSGTSR